MNILRLIKIKSVIFICLNTQRNVPTANTGLSIINGMRVRLWYCFMLMDMVMVINAYLNNELNYCTNLYALPLSDLSSCSLVEMGRSDDDVIDDGDDEWKGSVLPKLVLLWPPKETELG